MTLKCKNCIEDKYGYIVYMHYNKINDKIYIGRTKTSLKERWSNGNGYRTNIEFNNDIKKFGTKNFEHEIIASGLTEEEANNFEVILIEKLNTTNRQKGYNVHIGGNNGQKGLYGKGTQAKKVYCDGRIFNSTGECANYYNLEKSLMKSWLKGKSVMPPIFIELGLKFVDSKENTSIKTKSLNSKRVICNGKIFNSVRKCSEYYNINNSTLKAWLKGRNPMPQEYIELGLKYYDEEIKLKNPTLTKKVICDGKIFESIKKCSEYYNISYNVLINWLKGITKTPQEFQDKGLKYYKN